ncbi:hypothetical protein FWK35_00036896 [Aphis craccivora]|uniref:Uncharacterized protein n=1 Tax=Aphis craccivora TaxID=307492 RepID=A0A6G0VU15_APHCR|nr:hypothetical protein FWK35_00036896 [Aphis craccivora]
MVITGGAPSTTGSLDSISGIVVGMIGVVSISGDPSIMDYPVCFDFDSPNKQQNQSLVINIPNTESIKQTEKLDELDSTSM